MWSGTGGSGGETGSWVGTARAEEEEQRRRRRGQEEGLHRRSRGGRLVGFLDLSACAAVWMMGMPGFSSTSSLRVAMLSFHRSCASCKLWSERAEGDDDALAAAPA